MADQPEPSPHHRADVEVSQDGDKVTLKAPDGGVTLNSEEAQELASRIFEAAMLAGGEDPVESDRVRIPMQYLRLAAERFSAPEGDTQTAPNSDEPEGHNAEVHCWIKDQTQSNAIHIAIGSITEEGWFVQEIIEHENVSRTNFADTDYLEYFEQALTQAEVFLFEIDEDTEGK